MAASTFAPGFRLSIVDGIVLVGGGAAAVALWTSLPVVSLAIAVVFGHFFLFCHVFRVARLPELAWAGVFLLIMADVILWQQLPTWLAIGIVC